MQGTRYWLCPRMTGTLLRRRRGVSFAYPLSWALLRRERGVGFAPACLGHCSAGNAVLALLPRVFRTLRPRHAGFASFPPRPQARQANRGPRRATMPACRPLHGNKPANAGQQFSQPRHRRRANAITQALWAIACSTRRACWPIDRPQSRCFFWLLFFSAEKKSDEPRPAGRGTRPAGRPSPPRRVGHRSRPQRRATPPPAGAAPAVAHAPRMQTRAAPQGRPPLRRTRGANQRTRPRRTVPPHPPQGGAQPPLRVGTATRRGHSHPAGWAQPPAGGTATPQGGAQPPAGWGKPPARGSPPAPRRRKKRRHPHERCAHFRGKPLQGLL